MSLEEEIKAAYSQLNKLREQEADKIEKLKDALQGKNVLLDVASGEPLPQGGGSSLTTISMKELDKYSTNKHFDAKDALMK